MLWECYQLEPYHGLRKPCIEDDAPLATAVTDDGLVQSEEGNVATTSQERFASYACTAYFKHVHIYLYYTANDV